MRGLEPPRPYGHTDLNRARLPIPPHPRGAAIVAALLRRGEPLLDARDVARRGRLALGEALPRAPRASREPLLELVLAHLEVCLGRASRDADVVLELSARAARSAQLLLELGAGAPRALSSRSRRSASNCSRDDDLVLALAQLGAQLLDDVAVALARARRSPSGGSSSASRATSVDLALVQLALRAWSRPRRRPRPPAGATGPRCSSASRLARVASRVSSSAISANASWDACAVLGRARPRAARPGRAAAAPTLVSATSLSATARALVVERPLERRAALARAAAPAAQACLRRWRASASRASIRARARAAVSVSVSRTRALALGDACVAVAHGVLTRGECAPRPLAGAPRARRARASARARARRRSPSCLAISRGGLRRAPRSASLELLDAALDVARRAPGTRAYSATISVCSLDELRRARAPAPRRARRAPRSRSCELARPSALELGLALGGGAARGVRLGRAALRSRSERSLQLGAQPLAARP